MNIGSVHLASPWHQFRAFSELNRESRGGYLEGEICVPEYVSRIRISLATHGQTPEPHVNLLFQTPRNKLVPHCQEMKPSDHVIILQKVNDAFQLQQPSYWPNAQVNHPKFWINGKLVLGKNNLQLTVCKAVQKGQSKISVNEMIKYLNLRQFNGDLEKARLKVIFDDNPPNYSRVILDKAKYLIKIDAIRTRYICDQADQLLTIYFNKSVKITQDKCLKLTLFSLLNFDFTTYRIVADNVVEFKVNASRIGVCTKVYVVVSIDDQDIDGSNLYDQTSDDLTIDIIKHFEHPEIPCCCKLNSATDFKPTKVRNSRRSRPYPSTSGGARPLTIRRPQRPSQSVVDPPRHTRQPDLNVQSQQGQPQPRLQNAVLLQTNSSSLRRPALSHTGFSSRPHGSFEPISPTVPSAILQDSDSDSDQNSWQGATGDGPPEHQKSDTPTSEPSTASNNVAYVGAITCSVPDDRSEEDNVCLSINALTVWTDDEDQGDDIYVRHVGNANSSSSSDADSDSPYCSNISLPRTNSDCSSSGQDDECDQDGSQSDQHDTDQNQDDHEYEGDQHEFDQAQDDYEDDQHDSDEVQGDHVYEDDQQDSDQVQDEHDYEDDRHDSDQAQDDHDYEDCNDYDDYYDDYDDYDYSSDYTSD